MYTYNHIWSRFIFILFMLNKTGLNGRLLGAKRMTIRPFGETEIQTVDKSLEI